MSLENKQYVAIDSFSLALDNGKTNVYVKRGDVFSFDGLYVDLGNGITGMARSLAKTVGMWIVPADAKTKKAIKASEGPMQPRNATGGRIVENSEATQDLNVREQQHQQKRTYDELQELVNKYEKESGKTILVDDEKDMQKEADGRKKAQLIDEDSTIVANVRRAPEEMQTGKNTSGVQMGTQTEPKRLVVSSEERVVKTTNYTDKSGEAAEYKHLVVDHEAQGVVVKKTAAIQQAAPVKKTAGSKISREQDVVKETSYEKAGRTDVGSSTQAQTVEKKRIVITGNDQEAVVMRKVSKVKTLDVKGGTISAGDDGSVVTAEGITARVTVGGNTESSDGDVTFSANNDIDVGEVQISSGGTDVTDLSGVGSDDSDIDVNDILKDL